MNTSDHTEDTSSLNCPSSQDDLVSVKNIEWDASSTTLVNLDTVPIDCQNLLLPPYFKHNIDPSVLQRISVYVWYMDARTVPTGIPFYIWSGMPFDLDRSGMKFYQERWVRSDIFPGKYVHKVENLV